MARDKLFLCSSGCGASIAGIHMCRAYTGNISVEVEASEHFVRQAGMLMHAGKVVQTLDLAVVS